MIFAETKTRRPPGCGKSRSVESEENQKQVFLPSHRPWKSRTTRAIPIFPTAPTAAGYSTSLTTKVGVGPNETIKRGQIKLIKPIGQLRHFLPLVENVIRQTKERVVQGNSPVEDKVLSLFETHTEVIRKGKAHKPNEFGRLVRIDAVANGMVSGYQVLTGNPADTTSWMPALEQHQAHFGRAPEMAAGDRGFFSAQNEREAEALGVKKVALPARGRLSAKRAQQQKRRWFRRGLRWRAGIEATISTLKHPFSMARATYKGGLGFERYVGWCVITKNLFSIARHQQRRRDHDPVT